MNRILTAKQSVCGKERRANQRHRQKQRAVIFGSYLERETLFTYPEHTFAFKEGNTFLPSFISADNRYLIGVEPQENDENSVLILVERD